jgi:hypothetical protein
MRPSSRNKVCLVGLALVFTPVLARADAAGDAEALVARGIQLRRERHDTEALEAFEKAYALSPSARVRAQLGVARQAIALWVEAERDLAAALARTDDPWIQRHRGALAESLTAVRAHLGSIRIASNVKDAEVLINGAHVGTLSADPFRVVAGQIVIALEAPARVRSERTALVPPGTTVNVEIDLEPENNAGAPASSASVAPTPLPQASPALAVEKAPVLAPSPSVEPSRDKRRTAAWITAAGAGVLLTEAVVAQIVGERLMQKYNDDSRCLYGDLSRYERCGHYKDDASAARMAAIAGYTVGGLAAIAATYIFATSGVTVRAGAARDGARASVEIRF